MTAQATAPADAQMAEWLERRLLDEHDADDEGGDLAPRAGGPLQRVRRGELVAVVGLGLVQAALLVTFVLVLRGVIAHLQPAAVGGAAEAARREGVQLVGLMAVLALGIGLVRYLEFTVAERAGYRVVRDLRLEMYRHLQLMRPEHLQHRARGGLLLRLTGDLSMLRMWLSRGVLEGISSAIVLVSGLGVAVFIGLPFALAIVAVLALGALVSFANGRSMRQATRTMRRRRSLLIGNVDEQINAMAVSQVCGRTDGELARLSRQNDSLNGALVKVAELRGRLRGIAMATAQLTTVAVLAVGVVEVQRGSAGVPSVVAALVLARFLTRPVRTLGLAHDYWHRGLVSRQKVDDFLASSARDPEEDEQPRLRVGRGEVVLDQLSLPSGLQGIDAVVPGRSIVALTGPAGSGASDLLAAMARLVEPTSGQIRVDGEPLCSTSPASVGRRIGYVSPDLPLLRGTILRNLTYRDRGASAGEVQRVVYALGLQDVLQDDEGVQAWLHEGGRNLSAGDRQLVAIGRAMMGNPPILLLDEPMSSLGPVEQERVREAIRRYRGTVLMATSDPDDLALADQVWHLDSGRLLEVETGEDYRARQWALMQEGGISPWRLAATRP